MTGDCKAVALPASVHTIETLSPIQHLLYLAEQVAVSSVCKAIPIVKLLLTTKA